MKTILQYAREYLERGWPPIPLEYKQKMTFEDNWQHRRLKPEDLEQAFRDLVNIGVLLGEPSHGLIDIDLDHPLAVELAGQFLPTTEAIFGRASKPKSHWLYQVETPLATKKLVDQSEGMIVEIRSTGCQTVFPPSVHPCGELIEWHNFGEPRNISATELLEAVQNLGQEVGRRLPLNELSSVLASALNNSKYARGNKLLAEEMIGSSSAETPWPTLSPLDVVYLPTFPVDALPTELAEWVTAESNATQTPPDLAALLSLAVISACIAG